MVSNLKSGRSFASGSPAFVDEQIRKHRMENEAEPIELVFADEKPAEEPEQKA